MKTKSTKRALLASLLSLVICISMLVGSTFAWFTDSVTSANNIIQSGNLDVTMEWKDATTTGKQLTYKDASTGAIFNYDLWEPGYVEAKNVKISNVGSLALKYNVNIVANGEVSALADVIDVFFAEGEYILANREMTELTKIGTLREVLADTPDNMTGDLTAGNSDIVTIALKMRETAGNEYQGLSIGTDFKVVLMATQDNVEKDSFDKNYDDIEVPTKDIKVIDGNTYYYLNDGNVVLRSVPYGNVGSSFTVRNDVTLLGIGVDKGDTNGPVFSKYSPVETLTLNEGLVKINARAVTGVKTLTSVNFPSTLKFIGEQAFAQAGMTSLTIPANVEEIKFGAFRDMANLTTVTIKGNVAFDDYAFRSCPNLTSIYLLGDDVTFTGSQFATHGDNGDANGITIYVKNATVAARVYAAQASAYGYEVKILGTAADGSDAVDTPLIKDNTNFTGAVAGGSENVVLGSGNFSMPDGSEYVDLRGKELNIVGNSSTVIDVSNVDTRDQFVTGASLVFDGVTLNFNDGSGYIYMGFANTASLIYRNCHITGMQFLYGDNVTFENCVIDSSANTGEPHSVWTYGAKNINFIDCDFIYGDRAVNCFKDQDIDGGKQVVNFKNCTFTTTKNDSEGAVEINSSVFSVGIEVNLDGCTAPANGDMVFVSKWDGTDGAKTTINVNGSKIDNATVDHD